MGTVYLDGRRIGHATTRAMIRNDATHPLGYKRPEAAPPAEAPLLPGLTKFHMVAPQIINELKRQMPESIKTKEDAAAVVGNMAHESWGFRSVQEKNPIKGGAGGLGYAQHTGGRRDNFQKWLDEHNETAHSVPETIGFMKHEMTHIDRSLHSWWNRGLKPTTLEGKTKGIMDHYERPSKNDAHYDRRLDYAKKAMELQTDFDPVPFE